MGIQPGSPHLQPSLVQADGLHGEAENLYLIPPVDTHCQIHCIITPTTFCT